MTALTALAVAAPLALSTGASARAAAGPALALEAAQRSVVLTRYEVDDGDGGTATFVEGDLGVHVVARSRAFEVRAKRASYSEPVVLRLSRPGDDPVLATAPAVTGLPGFWTTTITDAAGKLVQRSTADFCPNAFSPVRRRPDATAGQGGTVPDVVRHRGEGDGARRVAAWCDQPDARTFAGGAVDLKPAAEQRQPLANAEQPPPGVTRLRSVVLR